MPLHDDDDESVHFRPEAWKVAWEAAQDVRAPASEVKAAAERLVEAEHWQQGVGWALLTHIGILLGSFGQLMSVGVCLLSWAIFMLEALLKFGRNWAHRRFFMDVPCAYVPIHEGAARDSLTVFGRYLMFSTLLELVLYVPYIYFVLDFCSNFLSTRKFCSKYYVPSCPQQGTNLLAYLLYISVATTIGHWVTSVVTVLTFHSAMGGGVLVLVPGKRRFRLKSTLASSLSRPCSCNRRGCTGSCDFNRVLCLTWWVHMARHRHLSSMVASAQPANCGLPGHWFENVATLRRIVSECVVTGAGDQVLNSTGPLLVSQEMGLRALVSLAKQAAKQGDLEISRDILKNEGFDLLVQVVREGKGSTCRGLAAAAIAVLATQHKAIEREAVELSVAVIPLKRLLRSKEHELKEVALGALLNTALNDEQFKKVLSQIHIPDGIVGGSRGTFMTTLMDHADVGPTTRCQELAIGLLARCLAGASPQALLALMDHGTKHTGLELLIALLEHGLTTEIKASAAGVLSELAFRDGKTIGEGQYGDSCIKALIQQLGDEPRIAYASTRALCNLAIKFPEENKRRIVSAGGIGYFVDLLMKEKRPVPQMTSQYQEMESFARGDSKSQDQVQAEAAQMQEQLQAEGARALWILALNNKENQDLIVKANAIPPLVEILWNPIPKVHVHAVAALSALAWNNKPNQVLIGDEGSRIFPRLVLLLRDIDDETINDVDAVSMKEKVLEKVAVAIQSFANMNQSNQEDLVKAGALLQLENIAQKNLFPKEKIARNVRNAMDRLKGINLEGGRARKKEKHVPNSSKRSEANSVAG